MRAVLVPFQPLVLSWFGRGELKTLKTAEPAAAARPLGGASLFSAFYLNELILKLTHRDDPHEGLFAAYDEAIVALREISNAAGVPRAAEPAAEPVAKANSPVEPVLRRFEVRLLRELGYAVELAREAGTGVPIAAEREYWYVVERGPIAAPAGEEVPGNAVRLCGQTLVDLEHGRYENPTTASQSKSLMRLLINHSLGGQELATRSLVRDLRSFEP
jgi:DNA repair protein RecO (recombination protein O)